MIEFKFMIIWLLNLIIENKFYKKKTLDDMVIYMLIYFLHFILFSLTFSLKHHNTYKLLNNFFFIIFLIYFIF
jgi:hypothetical protein